MKEFHSQIRQRAEEAQRSLAEARESGDEYLVEIRLGEMESLARIAAEHEVLLEGLTESLAAHGRRPHLPPRSGLPWGGLSWSLDQPPSRRER